MATRQAARERQLNVGRSFPAKRRVADSGGAPIGAVGTDSANVELIFGFVGPTGIDLNKVCDALRAQLRAVQYEAVEVRLSS